VAPPELLLAIATAIPPVRLYGSEPQVQWAESIRDRHIGMARGAKDALAMLIIKSVSDATWLIANRSANEVAELRWPDASQLAPPDPPRDERRR
jgi:hypothetical protein